MPNDIVIRFNIDNLTIQQHSNEQEMTMQKKYGKNYKDGKKPMRRKLIKRRRIKHEQRQENSRGNKNRISVWVHYLRL